MIVREKDPVERDSFIKTLESMGFRKDIDDPRGRQEIIDAVLPITVNVAEKIYGMIGNKTCAAAATSSGLVMTKEEFSESLRINYMDKECNSFPYYFLKLL